MNSSLAVINHNFFWPPHGHTLLFMKSYCYAASLEPNYIATRLTATNQTAPHVLGSTCTAALHTELFKGQYPRKFQRFQYCVFSFCVVGQASATNQPCRGRGLQRDTVEVTTLPCLSPLPLHHSLPTGQGGTVLIEPCVTLHTVAQLLRNAVLSVAAKKGFHLRVALPAFRESEI
jgi:hypothetical protein